jgi:hypothetical protein
MVDKTPITYISSYMYGLMKVSQIYGATIHKPECIFPGLKKTLSSMG